MNSTPILLTIGVLGGTGKEGKGLAYRWAKAGYRVVIGSRTPEKAELAAKEILEMLGGKAAIKGASNYQASTESDIVVVTVPYAAHRETIEDIKSAMPGKMLLDVTVPLVPPKVTKAQMPPAGSAAQEAHGILGEDIQVASAFQNISYEHLLRDEPPTCDVLVTGTNKDARTEALKLVTAAGLTGWDAGPIENSMVIEGLTSVLININKRYGSTSAGIMITGVNQE